jgi:hypothetical protein|tara:strand:- start:132 stop:545 length:414 start_codon:yes stop_codon:yes gene_type:complete
MAARERLNGYLNAMRGKPFSWGQHDCLTFTNDAYKAMYGSGWADDWLGRYMEGSRVFRRKELIKEFGYTDFNKAVDDRLQRVDSIPPLGALVTTKNARKWVTGVAMGVCTGTKCAFLDKVGVIYLSLDNIDAAWVKA